MGLKVELSEALDASFLGKSLEALWSSSAIVNSLPIDGELAQRCTSVRVEYKGQLARLCALELAIEALWKNSNTMALIQEAEAQVDLAFYEGKKLSTASVPEASIDEQLNIALGCGRLLFSKGHSFNTLDDILIALENTVPRMAKLEAEGVKSLNDGLLNILKTSHNIKQINEVSQRIIGLMTPIAQTYLKVFGDYIETVAESLDLKLQILEIEFKLYSYNPDKIHSIHQKTGYFSDKIAELDSEIARDQAVLLMFDQLGPEFAQLVEHYRKILTRLSLVIDDLKQLGRPLQ